MSFEHCFLKGRIKITCQTIDLSYHKKQHIKRLSFPVKMDKYSTHNKYQLKCSTFLGNIFKRLASLLKRSNKMFTRQ